MLYMYVSRHALIIAVVGYYCTFLNINVSFLFRDTLLKDLFVYFRGVLAGRM